MKIWTEDVFDYHEKPRPGKIEVVCSKPFLTQRDLSLAYTPGVALPCLEIEKDPEAAYRFTSKGNLVAVVTNGTAVLGLGDIGPLAGKPVMEGKATLFKRFADIDVFDLELDARDPDRLIQIVQALEPTFGGINLEDIKAPECFYIEEQLRRTMSIPVFHDDQHGTAIISGAALLNALVVSGKSIDKLRVVFCGAGAAGIACVQMYLSLGVRPENVLLVDTVGVVYQGRTEKMNPYKQRFAADTPLRTLSQALNGADAFVGVSGPNLVTPQMLQTMAPNPLIFAMANPDPEIGYDEALAARPDAIVATGRSDYPNQVNNVLGFPFIFRAALDVRAKAINDEMKLAAAHALAALAREDVPESVLKAYGLSALRFGREYLIPKPFDPRVLLWVAPAVASAAMASGVARRPIADIDAYRESLERILGPSRRVMNVLLHKARRTVPRRLVFSDGEEPIVLRAARDIADQKFAIPLLVGRPDVIRQRAEEHEIDLHGCEVIGIDESPHLPSFTEDLYRMRQRKGMTPATAASQARQPITFALMMLKSGHADAFVGGMREPYPETIRPAIQIIGLADGAKRVSALHLLVLRDKLYFCADTMVNIEPDVETLAEIGELAAGAARNFDIEPRIAFLAFSTFGSVRHPISQRVSNAVALLHARRPDLVVDGEMHLEAAVDPELVRDNYPHSRIKGDANILIFPDLTSGNIGYKMVQRLGRADTIGPILLGMRRPVHVLMQGTTVADIVNAALVAAVETDRAQVPRDLPSLVTGDA